MQISSPLSSDFLAMVSRGAGVYIMEGKGQNVLYVGKARNLRKRLSSYVRFLGDGTSKTGVMLSHVEGISTILTSTEKEALILEASLIKRHRPKYNIILRDDKNYPFIKVTVQEKWPRLVVTRRRLKDKARYFGPFSSAGAMWNTIRLLNQLFPLRRCKGKELRDRQRPCLNYQMKRCLAPCVGKVSATDYKAVVKDVLLALGGRKKELLGRLRCEMREVAANLEFERAAMLRDKIVALEKTVERQVVFASHHRNQDVFALARQGAGAAVAVLFVRDGLINGQQAYFIPSPLDDDAGLLDELLARFYDKHPVPDEIVLPIETAGLDTLEEWLVEQRHGQVKFLIPQRGNMVRLVEMAGKNARQCVEQAAKGEGWQGVATRIQKVLGLEMLPERITCIDISNIGGSQTVGSVVNFWQGKKDAEKYRHYKIMRQDGSPDDYLSMAETMQRHLLRAVDEGYMPNLLLVDGGKGQLNVARRILSDLGMDGQMELAGIAKEKAAEGERIYRPGRKNPLNLARNSDVLLLLMRIRDEAHRFGITFHRKWRNKEALASPLDTILGVGPAKKKALLKTMGSLKRIRAAAQDELAVVPGIGPELAKRIWHDLHDV